MIWILLPAYNEADSLPHLLPRIHEAFTSRGREYRLVVVNDGSEDATGDLLAEYAREYPLDVLTHPINRGLGETERDGFEHIATHCAEDDLIMRMDCDDTHHPSYLFDLEDRVNQGFDVVNTSRFQPGGGQQGLDAYRTFISRCANWFMGMVFAIPGLRDYSCGYRCYRARVIQDALRIFGNHFIQLKGLGFTSTLEMIVKLHMLGCKMAEVPFVLRYDMKRSPSKMLASLTTLGYLMMALLYLWPFDGWRSQYRGLSRLYRQERDEALRRYQKTRLRTISRISL